MIPGSRVAIGDQVMWTKFMREGNSIESWVKVKDKNVGSSDSGDYGGIYTAALGRALFKSDADVHNIAEYVASALSQLYEPTKKLFADVSLQHAPDGRVYVQSNFMPGYEDLLKVLGLKERPKTLDVATKRNIVRLFMPSGEDWQTSSLYTSWTQVIAMSLLLGDFDVHIGNMGIVDNGGFAAAVVRIDMGWAFYDWNKDIHPHSESKHLPGVGPTNHYLDFPKEMRLTSAFVNALWKLGTHMFDPGNIMNIFNNVILNYAPTGLDNWVQTYVKLGGISEFIDRLRSRQVSLQIYARNLTATMLDTVKPNDANAQQYANELKIREIYNSFNISSMNGQSIKISKAGWSVHDKVHDNVIEDTD